MTTTKAMTSTNGPANKVLTPTNANSVPVAAPGEQRVDTVTYRPRLNVYDLNDRYELHVDLPGSSSEHIHATIDDGVLQIEARVPYRYAADIKPWRAEYGIGDFHRKIRLGEDIDAERLTAKYEHGVLTLVLPKVPERQPRRVPIQNG